MSTILPQPLGHPWISASLRLFDRRNVLPAFLMLVLAGLVLAPLATIALATLRGDELAMWTTLVSGDVARNLLWLPLGNTLLLGALVVAGTLAIGGFMAWLVVLTDVPGRRLLGTLAALPFVIPSFAAAFAWGVVFRNERVGGSLGWLETAGINVPDWLAWGMTPTVLVLVAHYFSLVFMLVAAALSSVSSEMIEAAAMTGAHRRRIVTGIVLPVVTPAIIAAASLVFAGAASNFAAPALLGLPVNTHTLSTRLYGMISTGQSERGYALALILIAVCALALWWANRAAMARKSYVTVTGKGGRSKRFELGRWRWWMFALAMAIGALTTIVPMLVLLASSITVEPGSFSQGYTLHFWIGASDPAIAQGNGGVLVDPQTLKAATVTLGLGLCVALVSIVFGLMVAYVTMRRKDSPFARPLTTLAFVPAMVPGIAFGAAFIALFGAPIGPFPALYGTFALLVLAGAAYSLPFSVQAGRASMAQIAGDIEESAILAGASLPRRLLSIYLPLTLRGLLAGAVLVFVKIVRDLSLVVLLFTPAMPLLSVVAYRYASEGFLQHANAITALVALISVAATLAAQRLQGMKQPWVQD